MQYANQSLNTDLAEAQADRQTIQSKLTDTSNYVIELEQKVLAANQQSLDLLKVVRSTEEECDALKLYIVELKGKVAVYVPVKGD